MKVTIGTKTYTQIVDLAFSPQTELTGDQLPINTVQVQIHTTDNVDIGVYLFLYDDLDNLWAKYWITYAEHHDKQTLTIRASSPLQLLERDMLPAVMYSAEPVANVLATIFGQLPQGAYTIHADFASATITGFCPEQSARNRLQWVTLVLGAYVKSYFSATIDILPINNPVEEESGNEAEPGESEEEPAEEEEAEESTVTLIPIEDTYWKPSLRYSDWVTRVRAYAYSFTQGTPQTTDAWVTDGTNTYIVSKHSVSLANPNAPQAAPTHEITIDECYLINDDNIDDILTHLSTYYFKRASVETEVINNASYMPGDRVQVYTDIDAMAEGYIEKAEFSFGIQAKSRLTLTPVDVIGTGTLFVDYTFEEVTLAKKEYTFPIDYPYTIVNPYFDQTWGETRYIFRPTLERITGTIQSGDNYSEVECADALVFFENVLTINSVDDLSQDETGVVTIV